MPERLPDDHEDKWIYRAHTAAKHGLLEDYLKRWISILARGWGRSSPRIRLMLVDAFAGRGRYTGGEVGSPLVMASVADSVARYFSEKPIKNQQGVAKAVDLDCTFIEANEGNWRSLSAEVEQLVPSVHPSVALHPPLHTTFEQGIRGPLADAKRRGCPIFVFVDPNGFAGVPMGAIKSILSVPHAEVLITFMVSYIQRFVEDTGKQDAYGDLFALTPRGVDELRRHLAARSDRAKEALDVYMNRLRTKAGAKYVHPYSMWPEGGFSALYYLVHASTEPKALRVMKEVMKRRGAQGEYGFFGAEDITRRLQQVLIPKDDPAELGIYMLKKYANSDWEFEKLLDDLVPDEGAYYYIDRDVKTAAERLRDSGKITVLRDGMPTSRAIRPTDILRFPPTADVPRRLL